MSSDEGSSCCRHKLYFYNKYVYFRPGQYVPETAVWIWLFCMAVLRASLLIRLWEEVQIIYPCKYRVSHKAVPTLFFAILTASTHPNYKSLKSFENSRKFAEWWAIWMSRSQQIAKNRSGHSFVGHPVRWEVGQGIKTKDQKCFIWSWQVLRHAMWQSYDNIIKIFEQILENNSM